MTIVHIIYDSIGNPWLNGGGAMRTFEIYRRLATRHKIIIYSGNFPNALENHDGVIYKHIGLNANYIISRISFLLLVHWHVLRTKADIYIEDVGFPFPLLISKLKKRTIASVQFIPNEAYTQKRGSIGKIVKLLNTKLLKYYHRFITVSNYAAEYIKQYSHDSVVSVIPNGVIIPNDIKSRSSQKYIAYLGRIDIVGKGLDILLDAISQLSSKTQLKLKIAGSGEQSEIAILRNKINEKNLTRIVEFVGRVDGDIRHQFLRDCYFLVFPSQSETFGLSALEAFVYGKPVIASAVGGLQEIVASSHAGFTYDSHDSSALAQKIGALYSNEKLVKELGEIGRNFGKQFEWDSIALQFEKEITLAYAK